METFDAEWLNDNELKCPKCGSSLEERAWDNDDRFVSKHTVRDLVDHGGTVACKSCGWVYQLTFTVNELFTTAHTVFCPEDGKDNYCNIEKAKPMPFIHVCDHCGKRGGHHE